MGSGASQIAAYLKDAREAGKKIVPLSSERLKQWCRVTDHNVVSINLEEHRRILEHSREDQVISVETGIELAELDRLLASTNQWLPLSFGSTPVSLLETIITGDGGALGNYLGGPRRLVLGLTLAMSNGSLIRTGGRVVKNVTGYDLTKFAIGSYGIFALPVTAYLRLYARPQGFLSLIVADEDPSRLLSCGRAIEQLGAPIVACELIDARLLSEGGNPLPHIGRSRYLLLVRMAGAGRMLELAVPALLDVCRKNDLPVESISEPVSEAKIWSDLFDICRRKDDRLIELGISGKIFSNLWQDSSWCDCPFTFSISSGRCKMFPLSAVEQEKMVFYLRDYAKRTKQSLAVAITDEQYIKLVRHFEADRSEPRQLLSKLKESLDSSNCLSPFVCFEAD